MKFLNVFGLLIAAGSAFAGCDDDLPKYQACLAKATAFSHFKTNEEVVNYCKSFDVEECKDFREIVYSNTECVKETDVAKLTQVAGSQLPYLAYCAKKDDNNDCPLTAFIKEHYTEFDKLNAASIPDEVKSMISSDCKEKKCNARMVVLGDSMKEPMIAMGAPQTFGDTYTLFQNLAESYKNNNCDLTAAPADANNNNNNNNNNNSNNNNDAQKQDDNSAAGNLTIISYSLIGMILMSLAMMF